MISTTSYRWFWSRCHAKMKIIMGDMNAKVAMDNTGREEVIGKHGAIAEMNENGERWVDVCQTNNLVISAMLFPHEECHKRTWRSPDGVTVNHINHLAFSRRWMQNQDVRVLCGSDVGLDHHLLMAKVRLKICQSEKRGKWPTAFRGQQS